MPKLNTVMQQKYDAARERANAEGIRVVDDFIGKDGLRTFEVTSSSGIHGQDYFVEQLAHLLNCTCPAGQRGVYCKHRAAVRDYLKREAERFARIHR